MAGDLKTEKSITAEQAKQLEIIKKLVSENTKITEAENLRLRQARQEAEVRSKELDAENAQLKILNQRVLLGQQNLDLYEQEGLLEENLVKKHKEAHQAAEKEYQQAVKTFELREKELKLQQESFKVIEQIGDSTENLIGNLTGISDNWKKGFFGQLSQSTNIAGGFQQALTNMGKGAKDTLTPANILGSTMQKIQESTIALVHQQEEALADFNKATGAAGKYNDLIVGIGQNNRSLGISTADAAKAVESLKHQFTDFTKLDADTQKELATLTATMEKFGVSVEDTAQNIQFSTKVMGLNTTESEVAMRQIAATAIAIGETPQKLAADFKAAQPHLAAFGDKAIDKFKELAAVAKNTGLEMSKLLDLAGQFDTFEGAAGAVGKLNAILGGNFLDSLQMVNVTNPGERVKALRIALDQAGKSFDQMSYYERKAIAEAAGLKGVDDLAKLMTSDINDLSAAAKEEALSQEEMNKMAQEAQTIMDKFKNVAMSFAISMRPVIDAVKWLMDKFLALNDALGGSVIPIIISLIAAGWAFIKVLRVWQLVQTTMRTATTAFSGAQMAGVAANQAKAASDIEAGAAANIQAAAVQNQSKAATAGVGALVKLGAAIALIGAGVFLAAFGLSLLAESIKGMTGPEMGLLAGIFIGMGVGIYFLATASMAGAPGLAYLALVIGAVGAAIFLASFGISLIIKAMTGFFKLLLDNSDKLFKFSIQMTTLSLALALLLPGAIAGSLGIAALSASLLLLAGSLFFIKTDDLTALGTLFSSIAKISFDTADALSSVADSIMEVAEALEKVPEKKAIAFASTIQTTAFAAPIAAAAYSGGGVARQASSPTVPSRPLVIEIGGRALEKYILEVVNDEISAKRR